MCTTSKPIASVPCTYRCQYIVARAQSISTVVSDPDLLPRFNHFTSASSDLIPLVRIFNQSATWLTTFVRNHVRDTWAVEGRIAIMKRNVCKIVSRFWTGLDEQRTPRDPAGRLWCPASAGLPIQTPLDLKCSLKTEHGKQHFKWSAWNRLGAIERDGRLQLIITIMYRQNSLIRYQVYNDTFCITIYTP